MSNNNNYQLLTLGLMYGLLIIFLNCARVRAQCHQRTFNGNSGFEVCRKGQCLGGVRIQDCVNPTSVFSDATSVTVYYGNVTVFRRGAFQDLPQLSYIHSMPMYLKKIYPGAFLNLPRLQRVTLAFNRLEEVLWGVFSNSNISEIDLSRNEINFIEDEAFGHMKNLRSMNLIANKLTEFNKIWFTGSTSIEALRLAYNEIDNIPVFSFDTFPNLTILDLSFNRIKKIDSQSFNNVVHLKKLDLTSNKLSWVPVSLSKFRNMTIDELSVSLNRMSFLSTELLDNSKVKTVFLHPNPWQCPCYQDILGWLGKNNATLKPITENHSIQFRPNLPECSINPKSIHKCIIGYDEGFQFAQEEFFKVVNYSDRVWYNPTSQRPTLATAPPLYTADLSPLDMK